MTSAPGAAPLPDVASAADTKAGPVPAASSSSSTAALLVSSAAACVLSPSSISAPGCCALGCSCCVRCFCGV
jgi:hypothetical protein